MNDFPRPAGFPPGGKPKIFAFFFVIPAIRT